MKATISPTRHRRLGAAAALLVLTAMAPMTAGAQSSNVASLPPTIRADGPTFVHDPTYTGSRVEVRSIDVPFSSLSLMILNVNGMPESARGRVLGAHAHTKPCADDATASGPHHANPAGDPSKSLAAREVWLDISIDSQGRGTSIALFDWRIRKGDAGSVVIHAQPTNATTGAAGSRLMCTTIALGS